VQEECANEHQKSSSVGWMAYDRVWSSRDKRVLLAETELECEEATEGAVAPPTEASPCDNECGAGKEMRSDRHVLNASKCVDRRLYRGGKCVGVYRMRGSDGDFCERNCPGKSLAPGIV